MITAAIWLLVLTLPYKPKDPDLKPDTQTTVRAVHFAMRMVAAACLTIAVNR